MSQPSLKVSITDLQSQSVLLECEADRVIEFGRQRQHEPHPFCRIEDNGVERIVIAPLVDVSVPRHWFRVEPAGRNQCRVTNLSARLPLRLSGRDLLEGNTSRTFEMPVVFSVNRLDIRIGGTAEEAPSGDDLEGLPERTMAPSLGSSFVFDARRVNLSDTAQTPESMLPWLQTVLGLLQSAASSTEFFRLAAKGLVSLMGMDTGRVLLREKGTWQVIATEPESEADDEWRPSRNVLNRVLTEKRTFRHVPGSSLNSSLAGNSITSSMAGVSMAVVSPILNPQGEPIGVLYGERRSMGTRLITPLDAKLVEVLAWGVATGLARIEQESKALRTQALMEQFFTPQLARHIERNPQLLEGRTCDVTILFADIRKFSTISHRLGPAKTMQLINSVLGTLCDCVLEQDGVLVDFSGDELMAMWGAPAEQPDHPLLACRAATSMIEKLPELNRLWQPLGVENVDIGVGINTGSAQVGNMGSSHKFKYGPLGNMVNLASRVQGITKLFQTRTIITETTAKAIGNAFPTRRLGQVRAVNIPEAVMLYELSATTSEAWSYLKTRYEEALAAFESQNFAYAAGILGELMTTPKYRKDGPSLVLMQRAANFLIESPANFSPILEMVTK